MTAERKVRGEQRALAKGELTSRFACSIITDESHDLSRLDLEADALDRWGLVRVGEDDVAALDGSSLAGDRAIRYRVRGFGDADGNGGELVELANGGDVVLEVVGEREEGAAKEPEVSFVGAHRK